jgi:hypothetical protein
MPAVLLGQNSTEEPKDGQVTYESSTEEVPDDHTHTAAYMVLIDKEGNYVFEPDINKAIVVKRPPTQSEIKGSLATILGDIRTQETAILGANATIQGQMQMARQMQEQAATQQVLQQMGRPVR